MTEQRYAPDDLAALAGALLERAGLAADRAATVAHLLVEADLLGRTTHGLQLLPRYLDELRSGSMAATGDPEDHSRHPAALVWDGRRLPGPWLLALSIEALLARVDQFPIVTASIRQAHHTACLGAQLPPIAARGMIGIAMTADPVAATVAAPGGRAGVISGNPIAACIPTDAGPVLMDFSLAASFGQIRRARAAGRRLPGAWLSDSAGAPSDDPAVLDTGGAVLPLGGIDMGHKGFALGLLVDLLCSGLAGFGRADGPAGWQANAFVAILNPAFFAGLPALRREAAHVTAAIRASPRRSDAAVRVAGDLAFANRARALREGLALPDSILAPLFKRAREAGLPLPQASAPGANHDR